MLNNKGQALVILILIMTVALAIGLSIVQKSLVDVSTSSKVEQSSRAFSAAEAGVEKALTEASPNPGSFTSGNNSSISSLKKTSNPAVPSPGGPQDALEISGLSNENIGQAWLANYNDTPYSPPTRQYTNNTLEVYWGDPTTTNPDGTKDIHPALELTLVYWGTNNYPPDPSSTTMFRSYKWYFDDASAGRTCDASGFQCNPPQVNCGGQKVTVEGISKTYNCKSTIGSAYDISGYSMPPYPILVRARLLYNKTAQPFAVHQGTPCNDSSCWIPSQKNTINSVGVAGETQRTVQVTQQFQQVPHYFDYAIFSAGSITK